MWEAGPPGVCARGVGGLFGPTEHLFEPRLRVFARALQVFGHGACRPMAEQRFAYYQTGVYPVPASLSDVVTSCPTL